MSDQLWDAFISHASEDKDAVARPLFSELSKLGLRIWFDEQEIQIGDSLSRAIDIGLSRSRFGIIIVSEFFLKKNWTEYEYRGLVTKEMLSGKTILPVWHNVDAKRVAEFSPTLADKYALNFLPNSVEDVALKILQSIDPGRHSSLVRRIEYARFLSGANRDIVDISKLKQAPIIHGRVPESFALKVKLIWLVLSEVDPSSFESWITGFRRDAHPTRELLIWFEIATAFFNFKKTSRKWSVKKAKAVFEALLAYSCNGKDTSSKWKSKVLTLEEYSYLIELYKHPFSDSAFDFLNGDPVGPDGIEHRRRLPSAEDLENGFTDENRILDEWLGTKGGAK